MDVWQRFITWRFRCKPIWHVIPVFAKPLLHQEEVGRTHILSILIQLKKDGVKGSLFKSHRIPWHCSVDKIPAANILDNPFQLHLVFPLVIDYKIIQSVFMHVPINQNCIIREGMMKFSLQMCKSSKVMDDGLSRCGVHWDRLEGEIKIICVMTRCLRFMRKGSGIGRARRLKTKNNSCVILQKYAI